MIAAMTKAKPISNVIGENLRHWRSEAGVTQDEVARAALELGFEWTQATVAAIETGRREVSLGEFVALPFIANRLAPRAGGGRFRRLYGFLAEAPEAIALAKDVRLADPANNLWTLFDGAAVGGNGRVPAGAVSPRPGVRERIPERVESELDAQRKAARSLGVEPGMIGLAAWQLWGRNLTDERDARVSRRVGNDVSARSLQAHRGHVTRELLEEIRGLLPKRTSPDG